MGKSHLGSAAKFLSFQIIGSKRSLMVFEILLMIFSYGWVFAQQTAPSEQRKETYFPPSDLHGGWRSATTDEEILQVAGMEKSKLDDAYEFVRSTTKNGGLLVVRHGYLVYENYFGKGQREAAPNLGSCGKSFTSIAVGILMEEHPELFPEGLDQKIFTPAYFPSKAFPLPDPDMADIKLGQLLSFSAGIRGNNPVYINGIPSKIDPVGPDGWYGMTDEFALGLKEGKMNTTPFSAKTLWCEPGGGYSYATASIHDASIMVRHIAGVELEDYITNHIASPLGWGRWGYGYKYASKVNHTPGGGGIALRSTDMLRFCYMLLHDGQWNGLQIVPEKYIHSASNATPYNPHYPYSLQFNVNSHGEISTLPRDAYWKIGSGGHCLYVVPSLDLIVWKMGGRDGQYGINDTGLPEPEALPDANRPLIGGTVNGDVYSKTLEMVISSIVEEDYVPGVLEGQIMPDPNYPDKLVLNKDDDQDGQRDPFFLCGAGDPEGFLYRGKRNSDGTRDGDQTAIINKMILHGGNSIYFSTVRTHGGDAWKDKRDIPTTYPDDMHNPWIGQDPENGLNEAILDQWDSWFELMDKHGIVIYFLIYDDAINVAEQFGWSLDDEGELDKKEKKFIHALVQRFKHHRRLIWCVMEEGQEIGQDWQLHISKIAEAIREVDDHNHIIASHQLGGNIFYHENDPNITQFAIQTDKDAVESISDLHKWMLKAWENSNGRYQLTMAEDYVHGNVSIPNNDREEIRKRNWAAAMVGAYVMIFGMDIANSPASWLSDCRTLQTFFEGTHFNQMIPNDLLAYGETDYVLANEHYDYIIYSSTANGNLGLKNLDQGNYTLTWLDCSSGEERVQKDMAVASGDQRWNKPSNFGNEVALYLNRKDKRPNTKMIPTITKDIDESNKTTNTPPVVTGETVRVEKNSKRYIQLIYKDADGGPGPYTITITEFPEHGTLSGVGNDRFYMPDQDYSGKDQFSWKVNDGKSDSNVTKIDLIVE